MRFPSFLHKKLTIVALLWAAAHFSLFFLTENIPLVWQVEIPLDYAIPFCDWFVIPYCLWFAFFAFTGFFFLHIASREKQYETECIRFLIYLISSSACATLCFLIFPNGVAFRPAFEQLDTSRFLTWVASLLFTADQPRNVFPSLHCLVQIVCSVALLRSRFFSKKVKTVLWIVLIPFSVSVFLATLFIRQHSVLDMLGAFGFAVVLYFPAYKVRWKWLKDDAS